MKYIWICLLFAGLFSCKKDNSSPDASDILRSGRWRMSAYSYREVVDYRGVYGDSVINMFRILDSCFQDDYLEFKAGYKGVLNTGTRKCGAQANELNFNWELRDNQTTLMLNDVAYLLGDLSRIFRWYKQIPYIEARIKNISNQSFTIVYYGADPTPPPPIYPATFTLTQTYRKLD